MLPGLKQLKLLQAVSDSRQLEMECRLQALAWFEQQLGYRKHI
jgi:hypothetical protein